MSGFKVESKIKNQPINYSLEGFPYAQSMVFRGVIPASGTTTIGQLATSMGKGDILVELEGCLYSDSKVRLFSSMNQDPDGVYPSVVVNFDIPPNGVVPLKYKTPIGSLQAGFSANNGDGTTEVKVGGNIYGIKVTNDLNPNATKVVAIYGDSTFGPTVDSSLGKDDYWMFKMKDWMSLNTSGKDVWRLVKKAIGGKTSIDFDKLLKSGRLTIPQEDVILWGFGINDQSQNTANQQQGIANYIAAFKRFYLSKRINNPGSYIGYLAPTPVQLTSRETSLNEYRLALATEISKMITNTDSANPTGKADPLLFAIDLSKSFDRTSLLPAPYGPYTSTDGTGGDALHPGTVISQNAIFNKIVNGLNSDGSLTNFNGILPNGGFAQLISAKKLKI